MPPKAAAPVAAAKPAAAVKPVAAAKPAAAAKPVAAAAKPAAKAAAPKAVKAVKTIKYVPVIGAARQLTSVRKYDAPNSVAESVVSPAVFIAPIRPDIVHFVHYNMAKNHRQAYSVNVEAGHQHSAHSWGTGRAVSRIPRVSGGGTSRAGQAAFGNMCRAGRMFAPTKIWRKWHRKINTNQKRFAVASALAASALPSLVLARGHRVEAVPEIPLVVESGLESITRTKQAIAALKAVGAYADVEKAKASRKLRSGKGKMRNRRRVNRRGPLIVFKNDNGIVRAFRNLPGVEIANVSSLNLLQLAPGGHLGRFVIWTKDAFVQLNANWGSFSRVSTQKSGYTLPRPLMANSDLTRLINSDEIQSKVRAPIKQIARFARHKNPLTNLGVRIKLNPYALALRRSELLSLERGRKAKAALIESKRTKVPVKVNAIVAKTAAKLKADNKKHTTVMQPINYARLLDHEAGAKLAAAHAAKQPKKAVVAKSAKKPAAASKSPATKPAATKAAPAPKK